MATDKQQIRLQVWEKMEQLKIGRFPLRAQKPHSQL